MHLQPLKKCSYNVHTFKKINIHACDETGNQQGQHQHLKHSHQQLSREGEEFHITIRHVVRPQGKSQDYACSEHQMWDKEKSKFYKNDSSFLC